MEIIQGLGVEVKSKNFWLNFPIKSKYWEFCERLLKVTKGGDKRKKEGCREYQSLTNK
jgi:hypothetical protein